MAIAVITGAASGIGAGLARVAVVRGLSVVLADRDAAGLAAVAAELGSAAHAMPTDVSDAASVERLAEFAFAQGDEVTLLFNNAGVLSTGLSWEIPAEVWQTALNVNIAGIVHGLRAFVPRLNAAGHPARIINTASVGGFLPSPFMAPYSATKFAVVALTEALAGELAATGSRISVSLLAPGPVKTGIFREPPMAAAQPFHAAMVAMLDSYGLSPDALAEIAFEGIDRGDYWIIPQPETLDADLQKRTAGILAREAPQFYAAGE